MIDYTNPDTCILHTVSDNFDKDLSQFKEITFDDAHYSIFKNKYLFEVYEGISRTIFITPNFINLIDIKRKETYNSYYMNDFFLYKNREQFLSLEEIYELIYKFGFRVGMHSYYHDIVYNLEPRHNYYRKWHLYKLNPNYKNIFKPVSKLANIGYDTIPKNINFKIRSYEEYINFIEEDTFKCVQWFKTYFDDYNRYAFPFFEHSPELISMLKKQGINDLYGQRIEIQ